MEKAKGWNFNWGRAGLTAKKTFEQRLKGNGRCKLQRKNIPDQKNTYKGHEAGVCLVENHL